jgi:CheY-like chemotaxis protein
MKSAIVCVIDDEPLIPFTIKRLAKDVDPSLDIITFTNASSAYNFLISNVSNPDVLPDLILLDINMPIMDGLEFLDKFKLIKMTLAKKIIIYVISSTAHVFEISAAKSDPNVSGFANKPLSKEKFEEIVSSLKN